MPAGPIKKAVRGWMKEIGILEDCSPNNAGKKDRHYSPYEILSERLDLEVNTIYTYAYRDRHQSIQFDLADRLLVAIDRVDLWWRDPELAEVYEAACIGADKIYPLVEAA